MWTKISYENIVKQIPQVLDLTTFAGFEENVDYSPQSKLLLEYILDYV